MSCPERGTPDPETDHPARSSSGVATSMTVTSRVRQRMGLHRPPPHGCTRIGPYGSVEDAISGMAGDHPTSLSVEGAEFLNRHHSGFVTASSRWEFTVVASPWDY